MTARKEGPRWGDRLMTPGQIEKMRNLSSDLRRRESGIDEPVVYKPVDRSRDEGKLVGPYNKTSATEMQQSNGSSSRSLPYGIQGRIPSRKIR